MPKESNSADLSCSFYNKIFWRSAFLLQCYSCFNFPLSVFSGHKNSSYGSLFHSTIGGDFFYCPFLPVLCSLIIFVSANYLLFQVFKDSVCFNYACLLLRLNGNRRKACACYFFAVYDFIRLNRKIVGRIARKIFICIV